MIFLYNPLLRSADAYQLVVGQKQKQNHEVIQARDGNAQAQPWNHPVSCTSPSRVAPHIGEHLNKQISSYQI